MASSSTSTATSLVLKWLQLFPQVLMFLILLQLAPLHNMVEGADADPLQDFCVGDITKDMYLNGYPCKNPTAVTTNDFIFHGLAVAPPTNNSNNATAVFGLVRNFPGLNSLGLSIARADFAKGGLIPPHTHPRGSEIIYVVKGSLYAGFISSDGKLFAEVIGEGDVMVFPRGLIHFELNVGDGPAQIVVCFNSQDAGVQFVAKSMFGSNIKDEVLEKTFSLDQKTVDHLKSIFSSA